MVAELPFGKGKHFLNSASGLVDRILGGWEVTGFGRVTSGRPFTAFSGTNTVSNVNQSTANCNGCSRGDGTAFTDPANGLLWYLRRRRTRQILRPRRRPVRQHRPQLLRRTALVRNRCVAAEAHPRERAREASKFRADATNLTNTPSFGGPTTDITSSTFGRIRNTVSSSSRKIQLGAKIRF